MDKTFLIYDIESSDLSVAFAQVFTFAAIRTDLAFNVLEEHEIIVKVTKDTVPSAQAILVNQLSVDMLNAQGVSEDQAIKTIHGLFNTPGTISIGYNTLGFDDELLRFSFYRHLLAPYTHQYAQGCQRMDLYPMTVIYYLFENDMMQWPQVDGKVSLKLEALNELNGLAQGRSHHAMTDVKATLELARRMYTRKAVWDFGIKLFNKAYDQEQIKQLPTLSTDRTHDDHLGIMIDGKLGSSYDFMSAVIAIGRHNHYKNQTLWLMLDRQIFSQITDEEIRKGGFVIRKKMGEPPLLLPPLDRFVDRLTIEQRQIRHDNLAWISHHPQWLEDIARYFREWMYAEPEHLDLDASLYQSGFRDMDEQAICHDYHMMPPTKRSELIHHCKDTLLARQIQRHLWRFHDEYLPDIACCDEHWQSVCGQIDGCVDYKGKARLSAQYVMDEIAALYDTVSSHDQALLIEWGSYLSAQFKINSPLPQE